MIDMESYIRNYCKKLRLEYIDIDNDELEIVYDFIVNNFGQHTQNLTSNTLVYFGLKYYADGNYDKMEEYYLKEIQEGNSNAMYYYGVYFERKKKDLHMMQKYYNMAIELDNTHAMVALALNYYHSSGKYERRRTIQYFLTAAELHDSQAMYYLGGHYESLREYIKAKDYYLKSITFLNTDSMIALGNYYRHIEKDFINMKKYYNQAILHGSSNVMFFYGIYYDQNMSTVHLNEYLELILLTKCKFNPIVNTRGIFFNDETYCLLNKIPTEHLTKELIHIRNQSIKV